MRTTSRRLAPWATAAALLAGLAVPPAPPPAYADTVGSPPLSPALSPASVTAPVPVDTALSGYLSPLGERQVLQHLPAAAVSGATAYPQQDEQMLGIPSTDPCPVSLFLDVRDPSTLAGISPRVWTDPATTADHALRIPLCDTGTHLTASVAYPLVQRIVAIPHAIVLVNVLSKVGTRNAKVDDLGAVLGQLGFTPALDGIDFGASTFSGIGAVGLPDGTAWQVSAPVDQAYPPLGWPTGADVHGFFVRNLAGYWQFAPMRWAGVDTSSTATWNTNTVHVDVPGLGFPLKQATSTSYSAVLPGADATASPVGGFQLLELSRSTLQPVLNRVYVTRFAATPGASLAAAQDRVGDLVALTSDLLAAARNNAVVVLQSISSPFDGALSRSTTPTTPKARARAALATAIGQVGGTPQAVFDLGSAQRYALLTVGVPDHGIESSQQVTPGVDGRIQTVLAPTPVGEFWTPQATSIGSNPNDYLVKVLSLPGQAWPHPANDAETRAFASIAASLGTTPKALRDQYRTNQVTSLGASITALPQPTTNVSAWLTMRSELQQEVAMAARVRSWYADLEDVMTWGRVSADTSVSSAVSALDQEMQTAYSVDLTKNAKTRQALVIASGLLTAAGGTLGLGGLSTVKDSLAILGGVAVAVGQASIVDPTEPAYAIGLDQLVGRTDQQLAGVLPNLLVGLASQEALVAGDYGRLAALSSRLGAATDGTPYFLDATRKVQLASAITRQVTTGIYQAALGAYFDTFTGTHLVSPNLKDWGAHGAGSYQLGLGTSVYAGYGAAAGTSSWDEWPADSGFSVEVGGLRPMFADDEAKPHPLSAHLLSVLTGSDPGAGQLGVYPPYVLTRMLRDDPVCDVTGTPGWNTYTSHDYVDHPAWCYIAMGDRTS